MKFIRKFLSIILLTLILTLIIMLVSHITGLVDIVSLYNKVTGGINNFTTLENKNSSFIPQEIKGMLKASEDIPIKVDDVKVIYGNTVITIPVPTKNTMTTFGDTIFAEDGSFYILATKDNHSTEPLTEIQCTINKIGYRKSVIVEFRLPTSPVILYVQCYTPEALAFFSNDINIQYKQTDRYDLTKSRSIIASTVDINSMTTSDKSKWFLDDVYLDIISYNRTGYTDYSDFKELNGKTFISYRSIDEANDIMLAEYAKLLELGSVPLEVGMYKGVNYQKFDNVVVLYTQLTRNSTLTFFVTDN